MNELFFLVGCTASGKKSLAMDLCEHLPLSPLSLDSMKVFRSMDRGTDKWSTPRFGLTDLVEPSAEFSVGEYCLHAASTVQEIRAAGRAPLFVGGTGLYLRALVRGLFDAPPTPPEIRRGVRDRMEAEGTELAHRRLQQVDRVAAERIHPQDGKRIARGLEVFEATGVPLSQWQREHTRRPIPGECRLIGLVWPDAELRQRIESRVDRMLAEGLVSEVRSLDTAGTLGRTASEAIGYREVLDHLRGRTSLEKCREQIARNTWRLSRRQRNWFRQFPEIRWIDATRSKSKILEEARTVLEGGNSTVETRGT